MKAAIVETYGSPEVLELRDIDVPVIGATDVLIQVHASAVTQGDRRLRSADFPGITYIPGLLAMGISGPRNRPGTVFAGRVTQVGDAVSRFAVGDDVFGIAMNGGALAEYLAMPQDSVIAKMPADFGYEEAAAVPYGAGTALEFLADLGKVQPGERILIVGASGGVGRYAVQIAKHLGAEVTGVASRRSFAMLRDLGADHAIDYAAEDFTQNGKTYDVIFDTSGSMSFREVYGSLTPTGRYLTLAGELQVLIPMLITSLTGGRRALFSVALGGPENMDSLRDLMEKGVISPVIDTRFPLEQIVQAHTHLENRKAHGSVVVTF